RSSAHWVKKFGDAWEEKGVVTAGDFVWSWKRLLDPETKSPAASTLDAIPGCYSFRADGSRGTNIDAVGAALLSLAGDGKRSARGARAGAPADDREEPRARVPELQLRQQRSLRPDGRAAAGEARGDDAGRVQGRAHEVAEVVERGGCPGRRRDVPRRPRPRRHR